MDQREQGKLAFWSGVVFFVLMLTGLSWAGLQLVNWLQDNNKLPMTELILQGNTDYVSEGEVKQALIELASKSSFFTLNVDEVQGRLEEMPWVYSASVRKRWPNTLKVYLLEQPAVAYWNNETLLNKYGDIFVAPKDKIAGNLVQLYGPDKNATQALEVYGQLKNLLNFNGYEIKQLQLTNRLAWNLVVQGDIEIRLGREQRLTRVQRFIDLAPLLELDRVKYIDLRYDTGFAVGWKTEQELTEQSTGTG